MIIDERTARHESVVAVGRKMLIAARTAPKARGVDIIEAALIEGEDLKRLSDTMMQLFEETGRPVFRRDSANIMQGECVLVVGTHPMPIGLNCGHCGFPTCAEKPKATPCAFNTTDIGIAIGSACSVAADSRIDTRVMYSAGMGAQRMDILPGCRNVIAIAMSASSKSPFFDRPQQ